MERTTRELKTALRAGGRCVVSGTIWDVSFLKHKLSGEGEHVRRREWE